MPRTITLWERMKRLVANLFEIKTKGQIREHFEKLEEEKRQQQLKLELAQYRRQLAIENADKIEAYHQMMEERRRREEAEKRLQEAIKLYKSNRSLQEKVAYREVSKDTFEEVAVTDNEQD